MSHVMSVIPGLTRNPVLFRIPAFAGMTAFCAVATQHNYLLKKKSSGPKAGPEDCTLVRFILAFLRGKALGVNDGRRHQCYKLITDPSPIIVVYRQVFWLSRPLASLPIQI